MMPFIFLLWRGVGISKPYLGYDIWRFETMGVRRTFLFVSVALILIVMMPSLETAGNEIRGGMEVLLCNPLIEQLGMSSTLEAAKAVGVK